MTEIGDLTGKQLGHFKILRKLGAGGMAVVYKAHELSLNRTVALKVIGSHLMEDPSFVERFQREAQAAARINHPNIVQIYSIGEDDGLHYFAMEYIDGRSLEEIIKEEGFVTVPKALPVVRQVASALAEAHAEDIVHRDIKPANVMIDGAGRVKVADFGIAFMQTEAARLTQEGAWVGTPKYVSPEQCRGEAVDGRSDIYSLGVTLYEMLTGRAPFDADTPAGLVMQIVKGESEPIERVNPTVPGEVGELIGRMIALDPSDRFQSAEDLVHEVERMEDMGLTTASHQVHPDGEGLPPTVALGRDEEGTGPPTEVLDSGQAATEVVQTGAGDEASEPPAGAPGSAEEAPAAEATRTQGDARDAESSDAGKKRPHAAGGREADGTPPRVTGAGSGPADPAGSRPSADSAPDASGPAARPATSESPATQPAPAEQSGGTRWSRIGLAAAAVVILALLGVVFAMQMSGASRSEQDATPGGASGPVADAGDTGATDPSDDAPGTTSRADAGATSPDAPASAEATDDGQGSQSGASDADAPGPAPADGGAAGVAADATGDTASDDGADTPASAGSGSGSADGASTADAAQPAASGADEGTPVQRGRQQGSDPDAAAGQAAVEAEDAAAGATTPPADEPTPEPVPTLPPAGSVVLTTSAEGGHGDLIHSLVERRLLREDFDVVDAGSFPGERMADLARLLFETTVSVTGRERVSAYGVTVDKITVSLGIRAVSLLDGRTLSTVTDTVTYTPNDAEQKFDAAVHRLMQDVIREVRQRTED